jgi:hypothetical protein
MTLNRRDLLLRSLAAGACGTALPVWAHHGWSSFDQSRPIYLEGRAVEVRWRNPHAELLLELPERMVLPADLRSRSLPAQQAGVDGPALLARTTLPRRTDRRWDVELAPLFRLQQWQMKEIAAGDPVAVVGFAFAEEKGAPLLRAEYVFHDGRAVGLRSSPA